jgi:Glycosyltransferase family 87
MQRLLVPLAILLAGATLSVRAASNATYSADYVGSSLEVNRTGDAVQALSELDLDRFFATQPPIGPVSVIARAPFAAVARIGHDLEPLPARYHGSPPIVVPKAIFDSQLRLYKFGIFPCLMALVLLAAFAARALERRGRPVVVQLLVAGLIFALPLWEGAIELGHPDEFLTTGLALGAVVAAVQQRVGWAAVLIGLALASKQSAILALPAILLAIPPAQVKRLLVVSVSLYLLLTIPMVLGNPQRFWDAMTAPSIGSHGAVGADTIWFRIARPHDKHIFDGVKEVIIPQRRLPHAVESAVHPFTVVLAVGLALLYWRRRRPADVAGIFNLLALIFLLRCMLDPVTNDYYHAPLIVALALYEGFSRRQLPILTLIVTAAFIPRFGITLDEIQRANALYLAWSIPLAIWLTVDLFRRPALPGSAAAPEAVGSWSHST